MTAPRQILLMSAKEPKPGIRTVDEKAKYQAKAYRERKARKKMAKGRGC